MPPRHVVLDGHRMVRQHVFGGDEIGLYNAGRWALDTNRNFVIDPGDTFINSNLYGYPIVGDFNGDGLDDLAVHHAVDHQFRFDLNRNGTIDAVINWGFPGVLELPVAADMNQDGIDDIGLWVPRNSTQLPRAEAEWFFLISDDSAPRGGFNVDNLDHAFKIVPFGTDLTAHFGDELARPIVGNFDPPVTATSDETPTPGIVFDLPGDFDNSGVVDQADYELWKSQFGQSGTGLAADANQDGTVDISDFTIWRNHIGTTAADYAAAQIVAVPGDYNSDGVVDTDDYQVWKSQYGMTGNLSADGNQDGRVDLADFTFWRNSLTVAAAEMSAGGVAQAIEAPAPLLKAAVADEAHASDEAPLLLAPTGFRPFGRSTLVGADPERVQATVDAALTQPDDALLLYSAMPLETQRDETDLEDLFELAADEEFEANQEGLPLTLTTEVV